MSSKMRVELLEPLPTFVLCCAIVDSIAACSFASLALNLYMALIPGLAEMNTTIRFAMTAMTPTVLISSPFFPPKIFTFLSSSAVTTPMKNVKKMRYCSASLRAFVTWCY